MAPDRRVDAHGGRLIADSALELGKFFVKPFAHAVQALEFEWSLAGQGLHRADRVRVVGGEGGIDAVAGFEQPLGAGEVADIGRDFAGEDGIIGQARDLRHLYLAVPIGALDQPDHQLALVLAGQFDRPVDQRHGTL